MLARRWAVAAGMIVCLWSMGCRGQTDSAGPAKSEPAAQRKATEDAATAASSNRIQPGWGIAGCHIGMAVDSLGNEWVTSREPFSLEEVPGILDNPEHGMTIGHEDGRVDGIDFHYLSDGFTPFPHGTIEGVSADSTFSDIKAVYGEASFVIRMTQGVVARYSGTQGERIVYIELGILFSLIDGRLAYISVQAPRDDFDYERLQRTSGHRLLFIREPDASPKDDEPEN